MIGVELGPAREALRRHFHYPDFRPLQQRAISAVLSGRDALIVLPTGGGKSICFQVPALVLPGLTVVVSPLISLMADQVQSLQSRGIAADFLNSTLSADENRRRLGRLERGETKLLYVAPERLTVGRTTAMLRGLTVSMLAVDEAHCASIWGQDFRPSYAQLADVREALGHPQTVALTATATPAVRDDIVRRLGLREPRTVIGGFDRDNLRFAVRRVGRERERRALLIQELLRDDAPAVVYAATRAQVETVARAVDQAGVRAVPYHGGMEPERRARTQESFMRGGARVIVATNAFGMGIDKPDVRLVAHYTMSGSLEDYYQEAGRAGRDGAMSRCILFHAPSDRLIHEQLRERSAPTPENVSRLWQALVKRPPSEFSLDPEAMARAVCPPLAPDAAERIVERLVDFGLLLPSPDTGQRHVRMLATASRIASVALSLSRQGSRLLSYLTQAIPQADGWLAVEPSAVGLAVPAMDRALAELASRQLVYSSPGEKRGTLVARPGAEARLDQLRRILHRRLIAERAKLDAMAGYAIMRGCRRDFILRYFGDKNAPSRCDTCDNCTG